MSSNQVTFAESASKFSRSPLGIIALFLVLVEGIVASTLFAAHTLPETAVLILIIFITSFPCLVLVVFAWLVARHGSKLFGPSDFRNDDSYLKAQQIQSSSMLELQAHSVVTVEATSTMPALIDETLKKSKEDAEKKQVGEWGVPRPNWKKSDYAAAVIGHFIYQDLAGAQSILSAFFETNLADESDERAGFQAFYLLMRIRWTLEGSLEELKELNAHHPNNWEVASRLANAFNHYKEYGSAAEMHLKAASLTENVKDKLDCLSSAAQAFKNKDSLLEATEVINTMKKIVYSAQQGEDILLSAIRDLSEYTKQEYLSTSALERLVEITPADRDLIFSLAYKIGEAGDAGLSLYHYLKIPDHERTGAIWNNIGFSYEQLRMPAKSVSAYREAKKSKTTIAYANLAKLFINIGFIEEAKKEIDEAVLIDSLDSNIGDALTRLRNVDVSETNALNAVLSRSRSVSAFYRSAGNASTSVDVSEMHDFWGGATCVLTASIENGLLELIGSYEHQQSQGILAQILPPQSPVRVLIRYRLSIQGRLFQGIVSRTKHKNQVDSVAYYHYSESENQGLMVLSEDQCRIEVLEVRSKAERELYALTRENVPAAQTSIARLSTKL